MKKYLLSLLLLLPITFTFAQEESSEEEVENVIVLGVKQSLIDAIELKRSKVGVTEAITAEDIGKFPDQNLAESLGRIAGITIDRSNVEGSTVNVRGLGYMFNLVTLNGRSMPTVAGQYDHGRGFDFGDISSHGVSAVEVYKSSNAMLPSGGIGATINMVTTKPLLTGDAASFSIRGVNDTKVEVGDEITPEFDFIFSRSTDVVFGDHILPFGFSVSGSHQERHNREVGTNEITWVPGGYGLSGDAEVTGTNGRADGQVFLPDNFGFKAKDNERLRENFQTTVQIGLTDNTTLTLDRTVSELGFETTGRLHGTSAVGFGITEYTVNEVGAVVQSLMPQSTSVAGNGEPLVNQFLYGDSSKRNVSQGANLDIQVTDNFNLQIDHHESTSQLSNNGDNAVSYSANVWQGGWAGCYGECRWYETWNGFNTSDRWASQGDRTFDATGSIPTYTTSWTGTGGDTIVAEAIAPREAYISEAIADGAVNQTQLIGTWDDNMDVMPLVSSIEFGISKAVSDYSNMNAASKVIIGNQEGDGVMTNVNTMDPSVITMTTTDSWTGDLAQHLGTFQWAELTIADAIYWAERAGFDETLIDYTQWLNNEGENDAWWLKLGDWSEACTANDPGNTGWSYYVQTDNPTANSDIFDTHPNSTRLQSTLRGDLCAGTPDSTNRVEEETEAAFVNFNIDTDYNSMPVKAQLGLRYEKITRTSSSVATLPVNTLWGFGLFTVDSYAGYEDAVNPETGAASFDGLTLVTSYEDYEASTSSSYFLPSLNISLGLNDNEVIRFGISESIAQPSLHQVRAGFDLGAYQWDQPVSLNRGSPELEPYESLNIDFAYENYYAEGSYYAVNIFSKEIKGYHGAESYTGSFNNVPDVFLSRVGEMGLTAGSCSGPDWAPGGQGNQCWSEFYANGGNYGIAHPTEDDLGVWPQGTYEIDNTTGVNWVGIGDSDDDLLQFNQSRPVNKYDGRLNGIELAIQHLFEGTPFGVQANVTMLDTDHEADTYSLGEQRALPGFGDGANFSAFYEDSKFTARISYNYRAESYTGEDEFNPLFIEARGQLDFNASYNINDNAVVFVEGLNVNDKDVRLFSRHESMLFLYQDHGPIYKAGIRYKF